MTRHCCNSSRIIFTVCSFLLFSMCFIPQSVFAAHLLDVFELEGNAEQDSSTLPPDDWEALFDFPDVLDSSDLAKIFIAHTGDGGTSFIGGGSKDEQPISEWRWVDGGNSPPKAVIWDAYAANYVDDDGDLVYYFGADRLSNTGNTNIGFWFFKNSISLNPDGTFSGAHEVGDILIVSEFTQGGETPITAVYRWVGFGNPDVPDDEKPLQEIFSGAEVDCTEAVEGDCICATVNDGEEQAPWPYKFKNNDSLVFPAGVFLEGGFCGDIFGGSTQCFGSFMAVTRSSDELNAVLEDFELNQLGSCQPDLQVNKTAPAQVLTNSRYTYNIQVTNTSNTFASGVTLTDTLPPEVTYVFGTVDPVGAGTIDSSNDPVIEVDLGVMEAGATVNIAITVDAPATAQTVVNTAVVTLTQEDPDPGDNTSQTTTEVVEETPGTPELSIAKFGPASIIAGEALTYTIAISNTGDEVAENVNVTDTFPAALTDISWTCTATPGSDCGSSSGNGDISINNATVAAGGTITYTIDATVASSTAPGSIINTASVNDIDDDVETEVIRRYDIVASKTCAGTVLPGSEFVYTIVISNSGISDAEGITVVDDFPTEVINVSWTCVGSGGATCSNTSGAGDINELADIPAGGSLTFTVNATLNANVPGNTQVPNFVTANTPLGEDVNTGNNLDIACLLSTPESLPDISITKAAPAQVATGSSFTYTVNVANNGPATATGVTLVDVLPDTVTYNSATITPSGAGIIDASNEPEIVFDLGDMLSGESVVIAISATAPGSAQTLLNQAEVGLNEEDSDPDDNFADAETDVVPTTPGNALPSISKSGPVVLVAGEQITYTIIVGNTGELPFSDQVTDFSSPLIESPAWSCSTTGTSTCDPSSGTGYPVIDVTVNPGEFATITFQGIVPADTEPGTISNSAYLNRVQDHAFWETEIIRRYDALITKTCPGGEFREGDAINYTVRVLNNGLSDAFGIIVTDDLASELDSVTWTCSGTPGTVFNAAGSGDLNETVDLPAGGGLEYTITALVGASAVPGSEIPNTASITPPAGEDSIPSNNTANPCSIPIYPESVPIPTLSEWGMIIMLLVMTWTGYRRLRRQSDFG